MTSDKELLKRPRCKKCGKRIYRNYSPFKNYLWRDIPEFCPKCGEKLSFEKKKHLLEHEEYCWMLNCIGIIIFLIIIALIFF
ncbi:MAG: hypothetical protein ACFE8B_11680 [Candidatus Hermodarchaeota archaeon]